MLLVMLGAIALQEGRRDTVTQPILIVEVLSNSTKNYDRSEKFADYRTIPTFQEYLLVDQSQPYMEQYIKQEAHKWLLVEHRNLEDAIVLSSLGMEFSLADLYEDVEF